MTNKFVVPPYEPTAKRTAKDTVFCRIFPLPKYRLALYRTLHPEDKTITAEDIRIVSLENIVLNEPYNDLGMIARGKLLILVEAQSTWTTNILMRLLLYVAATYQDYIKTNDISLYGSKVEPVPLPEFYVLYTGEDRDSKPAEISLAKDYFDKADAPLNLIAKVIKGEKSDIVWQYVRFTEIWDESVSKYGLTRQAAEDAINRCIAQDVLAEYFEIHRKEVITDMMVLFDEKYNVEAYARSIAKDAAEKASKESAILTTIKNYKKFSQTADQAANALESEFGISAGQAKEYVSNYWNQVTC